MEPVLIVLVIFSTFFGIFYLHFSTRNKERLALIEKGADASIFISKERRTLTPVWKILVLNLALLLMAVGAGIFTGYALHSNLGIEEGVAYPGTIFLLGGLGLFTGFWLTKKIG